jgi:hypothetical protein
MDMNDEETARANYDRWLNEPNHHAGLALVNDGRLVELSAPNGDDGAWALAAFARYRDFREGPWTQAELAA